jgi:hypothetical protein
MRTSKDFDPRLTTGAALVAAGLMLGPLPAEAAGSGAAMASGAVTRTFGFTAGEQVFVVPAGVHAVRIAAVGAHGGDVDKDSDPGGYGGTATGTVRVSPGEKLYVEVGGSPGMGAGSVGGFNGGGDSHTGADDDHSGAGGGGASDVRTVPASMPGTLESRLVIAAGGGGGHHGGNGGAADDGAGEDSDSHFGGYGASLTAGGMGGQGEGNIVEDGGRGGLGVGGQGAIGAGTENTVQYGGGGGGGGYYGGGGGTNGDGGGGGSDHVVPAATSPQVGTNLADAPAGVTISYQSASYQSAQKLVVGGIHAQRAGRVLKRGLSVVVECRHACRVDLALTVGVKQARQLHLVSKGKYHSLRRHHRTTVTIGHEATNLAGGSPRTVRVRLAKHPRRVLAHARHWTMRLTASLRPADGVKPARRTVRVRR